MLFPLLPSCLDFYSLYYEQVVLSPVCVELLSPLSRLPSRADTQASRTHSQYWDHCVPLWLSSKEYTCDSRDLGLIPGLGRPPGEGNGNPLQCSCLGNLMGRGAWRAIVHGITRSQTWLSNWACMHIYVSEVGNHRFTWTWALLTLNGLHIWGVWSWSSHSEFVRVNNNKQIT